MFTYNPWSYKYITWQKYNFRLQIKQQHDKILRILCGQKQMSVVGSVVYVAPAIVPSSYHQRALYRVNHPEYININLPY